MQDDQPPVYTVLGFAPDSNCYRIYKTCNIICMNIHYLLSLLFLLLNFIPNLTKLYVVNIFLSLAISPPCRCFSNL